MTADAPREPWLDEVEPRGASRYFSERYREGFALECRAVRFARFLVEHGIDSISVSPDSFLAVKRVVAQAEHEAPSRTGIAGQNGEGTR
ncbi:MAG: hypothetical protein WD118_10755 [Phycisphaeraceae bacterium]